MLSILLLLTVGTLIILIPKALFADWVKETFAHNQYEKLLAFGTIHFIIFCGMLCLVYFLAKKIDKYSFKDIGVYFNKNSFKEFLEGFAATTIAGSVTVFSFYVSSKPSFVLISKTGHSVGIMVLLSFFVTLIQVSYEELWFRSLMLKNLNNKFGTMPAILINSVLFSSLHFLNPDYTLLSFVNVLIASIMLTIAYLGTKAIWMPIGIHLGWNFITTGLFYNNLIFDVTLQNQQKLHGLAGEDTFMGALTITIAALWIIWRNYGSLALSKVAIRLSKEDEK